MKKNNVDKRMPSKGDEAVRKELIKLAGDYKDPAEIEMDITYSGSFIDFIKSDIDLKRKTLKSGGLISTYKQDLRKP